MSKKLTAIFLLPALSAGIVRAQNSQPRMKADSLGKQLDQVVVTATKFPTKQSQTGKVITVIPHEELEKSGGKSLGQVLNEQAGIVVNGTLNNAGSNQTIYLRGAASGRALVTVDGVPVSDPSLPNNEFDINLIPVSSIERIEICKGAQSTLYGSDAIAGVINIITVKPDISRPVNGKASFAAGTYGTYIGSAQLYGKLADRLTYNVRYNRTSTDGFSAAYDSTGGKRHFSHDGYRGDVVATNVAWEATAGLTLRGFAQYGYYKTDLANAAFTDAKDYTSANKNLMLGGGFTYALASTTINGNYMYNTGDRDLLRDSVFGQNYYKDHYYGKTQYAEVFANTSLGSGFTLLNGADYRYASMNENGLSGSYPMSFKDTSVSQTSMYSSLLYAGDYGLNVELGGRLNTHSRYGSNYTYTFNPSYRIGEAWRVYGSIASGFKAPSLYQLYGSYVGNPGLQPEKSTNYEAGVQYGIRGIQSRVTYFYRKISNGLDYNYFTGQYFNFNGEKAQGIEWENKLQLTRILSVSANYTWTKLKEESQSRVSYKDTTYQYALRRPEHVINVTAGVEPVKGLYVSVTGHYESKRYDIGGYDSSYNPLPDIAMGQFFLLNAYAEYRVVKRVKLFADAKNLTNRKFFTINGYNSIPFQIVGGAAFEF